MVDVVVVVVDVGFGEVVPDVVVRSGEAWACAGAMIESTTGFVHFVGTTSVVTTPPMMMVLVT